VSVYLIAQPGEGTVRVDVEYANIGDSRAGFDVFSEDVYKVAVTDGGVLLLTHSGGKVSAVSPTGWARVSVR
jgi:hypothetical protein